MSINEMDSWAIKSIMLLNSKTEDSAEQMRQILEESLRQKYGNRKHFRPIPSPTKRTVEIINSKKAKLDPKVKSSTSEVTNALLTETDSSSTNDSDDLAMEILENDLACVVCREIAVVPKNRLVECAECHALYHQECHSPNISDMDVSDPRLVWYCSGCNKAVVKPKSSSSSSSSNNGKHSYSKSNSSQRSSQSSSSSAFSSKPFGGLPVPGKKSSSGSHSKSSSSSSSSKSMTPNINIISADKRLQIMKKRAAKKQEKRILPK